MTFPTGQAGPYAARDERWLRGCPAHREPDPVHGRQCRQGATDDPASADLRRPERGDDGFLVLADATFDGYRSTSSIQRAEYAQINLGSVLFVVPEEMVGADPGQITPKAPEEAFIAIPPFT